MPFQGSSTFDYNEPIFISCQVKLNCFHVDIYFCERIIIVRSYLLYLEPNPISDLRAFVDAAIQDRFLIEWRKPYPNIALR